MVRHWSEHHGEGTPSEQQYRDRKLRPRSWAGNRASTPRPVAKWQKQTTVEVMKTRQAEPRSNVLTEAEEAKWCWQTNANQSQL